MEINNPVPAPPTVPVIRFQTPDFRDRMLVEAHNTEVAEYRALPYGTPHPDVAKWSGYILVSQQAFAADEKWVLRFWTADPEVENTYNLAQHAFDGEDITKDIYVRTYAVRRTHYTPATKATTLSGVLYVRVTAGGSGYDGTTTVTFTGGAGSGAAGTPIVFRGAIVGVYLTSEGTGYTSNPTVAFVHATGTGAAATAIRQNALAVLIEEKAERMDGDPEDGIYLKVTRVYHVLPGATLTTKKIGEQGATETTTVQKRLSGTVTPAGGYLVLGDEVVAQSTVVDVRRRTLIDDWPILTEYDQHPELLSLITTTFEVVDASTVVAPSAVNGVVTKYAKLDQWRSLKIVTTYATPATYSEQRFMAYNFETCLLSFLSVEDCGAFINLQHGKSMMVQARIEISHSAAKETIVGLEIFSNTFHYGAFNVTDVLNDAGCLEISGTCEGSFDIPSSTPSATDYLSLFDGTEQLISGESVKTNLGGKYRNTRLYVTFPELPTPDPGTCP